jgi:phenylacetate-CoA ligase
MDFHKVYRSLPDWCQDIAITLKNVGVYYKKYNTLPIIRPIKRVQDNLKKSNLSELTILQTDELEKLKALIVHAVTNVEYYKNLKDNYAIPQEFKNIEDFPILEKVTLRTNLDRIVSKQADSKNSVIFKTSGTSGTPLRGRIKVSDLQLRFRIVLKSMNLYGIDLSKPYGRFPGAHISDGKRVYRRDLLNGHLIFSMYHISSDHTDDYIDAIEKYKLETLEGYPSVLYALALLIENSGRSINCVKFICTTAEKLHEFQKRKIEFVFGGKVFDYYGSSEQSSYLYMCPNQKYHNSNTISHLEVLDDNGNKTELGSQGNMIVTSYTSTYTPLIRYKIGDSVLLSDNQICDCGATGIVIDEIVGRDEDSFSTIDGRTVSRFSLVLKYLPDNVFRVQLRLTNMKPSINLIYESLDAQSIDHKEFAAFYNKLIMMIGEGYNIKYIHKEKIAVGANGKFKAVVIN